MSYISLLYIIKTIIKNVDYNKLVSHLELF